MAKKPLDNSTQSRRWLFPLILSLGLFVLAARPIVDPDLWWHLKTGELTLQNHAVFHADPFSFTRAGQPWINHEWLSDVLMFSVYRFAGWGGLIVVFAALISATYFLAFRRSSGRSYIAVVCTVWAAFASRPVWDARPQIFSLILASAFLTLHDMSARRPRMLWWTVPLMLLWVNLHAGYASGIALLFLFFLGDIADLLLGFARDMQQSRLGSLLVAIVACIAVVPLNPYGLKMYAYPLATLRSAGMQNHIAEWFSPDFHKPEYLPLVLLMLALLAALALSKKRLRPGELILLASGTIAALISARHVALYALIAGPLLSKLLDRGLPPSRQSAPTRGATLINVSVLLLFAGFVILHIHGVIKRQPEVEAGHFPSRATDFLAHNPVPGPIFNHYDWGGYLIWRLYPNHPVFIDGRADVYGDDLMTDFANASSLKKDWRPVLNRWKIRTILLPPDSPLITALKTQGQWQEIYADPQAVILTGP
ncbi:MAG TPA: hypothetical protein VH088_24840 [Terriglobales bacterium]|nr:hypothetical protein [Terriglobales bacterium]